MDLINLSDLKIGMYLHNEAAVGLPLYDNKQADSPPVFYVAPGEEIGQIVDFSTGPNGPTVIFTSDRIQQDENFIQKGLQWILSWSSGTYYGAAARFNNIQRAVTPSQIGSQKAALDYAEANGTSLKTQFLNAVHNTSELVSDTLSAAIPWKLLLALGLGYLAVTQGPKLLSSKK